MDDASAKLSLSGFSHVLKRIEAQKRLLLIYDQGREMAAHQRLTDATGVRVYFANPHSLWQRGINENTNGLLRQYLSKGSDLSGFTQEELEGIAWTLNTRPRKSRCFRCPAALFTPNAFDFRSIMLHFLHLVIKTDQSFSVAQQLVRTQAHMIHDDSSRNRCAVS
jgi:transposase, IS30 family